MKMKTKVSKAALLAQARYLLRHGDDKIRKSLSELVRAMHAELKTKTHKKQIF
jgi:hypothetical protein